MLLTAWSYARFSQNSEKSGSAYSYTAESLGPKSGFCRLVLSTRLSVITTHQCVTGCNLSHRTNSKFALLVLGAGIGRPCDFSQLFPYSITCQFKPRVCVRTHYSHGHFCIFSGPGYWLYPRLRTCTYLGSLWHGQQSLLPLVAGASVLCFSFLGFDAVTTLSNETKQPTKNIPVQSC